MLGRGGKRLAGTGIRRRKLGAGPGHRSLRRRALGARIGEPDEFLVPYTAGIPGVVRIVYLPLPRAVTIHHLEPGKAYIARVFDPTSGRRQEIGAVRPDERGSWTIPPSPGAEGDWVLLLEAGGPGH